MLAIITGASSGIGLALTRMLVKKGYEVIMLARDGAKLQAAAMEFGTRVTCLSVDIRNWTDLARLTEMLGKRKINLAMHAAGVLRITKQESCYCRDREVCDSTNYYGAERFLDAVLPHMECGGHLTVISSVAALIDFGDELRAYANSKKNLGEAMRARQVRFATSDVTTTIAYPSIVDTPMIQSVRELPAVYRAFKHHTAERAAASILGDSERRRKESFTTPVDRILIWVSRKIPNAFGRVVRLWIRCFERLGRS